MKSFLPFIRLIVGVAFVSSILEAKGATHTVNFRSNSFDPSALTVNVGDTVVFQRQDGFHTVTGTGSDPFCGEAAVATSCSVTFTTPGTFPYRCLFHSTSGANPVGVVGSVTVTDGNEEPVVTVETAAVVSGPFEPAENAVVSYPDRTITLPVPNVATFWRLNSTTALRITGIEVNGDSVILSFE
jgi:plastocyanin